MENDKLSRLIHSLNGAEKRCFTIWCGRHSGTENNITLQLFKDLCTVKSLDKRAFREFASGRPYGKNLRFNKHFLYKQLLRCLHAFHSGRNVESELREMMDQADILSEKGLAEDSLALVESAAKLALEYECFGLYYELKRKELELFRDLAYKGIKKERIQQAGKDISSMLGKAGALGRTETAIMQLLQSLSHAGIWRVEPGKEAWMLTHNLKPGKGEGSFRTSLLYYQGMGAVEFAKGNFESAYKWTGKVMELFGRFPHMKEEKKRMYLVAVQNHLVTSNYIGRYEGLESTIEELQKIRTNSPQLRNRIFYMTHNLILGTCANVGDFARGLKLIREIRAAHNKGEVQHLNLQNELVLLFNSALVYFGTGKYKEAAASLRKILDNQMPVREDLQSFARIFHMIIQLESGKQDLLEYSVRSAYRFFMKKEKLFGVEKAIIRFLRNSAHRPDTEKERREAFEGLRKELLPLSRKKSEQQPFRFFDLIAWLDSKLSGRYFALVLQEKNPGYWRS